MSTADRKIYWRCFHCGEAFTKSQRRHAADHFGRDESATPVCLMREPGEYHVLRALRDAQADLDAYRAEDTNIIRAMHSMAADHRQALIREEERGYDKGLNDGLAISALVSEAGGFALVPLEPTEAMILAWGDAKLRLPASTREDVLEASRVAYRAMLAARPHKPAGAPHE